MRANEQLSVIYECLDYENGDLLPATNDPTSVHPETWLEKGEWLSAAKTAGAETVLFVDNNPMVVFASCDTDPAQKIALFNSIWSMARPRFLFIASPGEISLFDLATKPVREAELESKKNPLSALEVLTDISKASLVLRNYHRDLIESGSVFEKRRFGDLKNRADQALIRDLKIVRKELMQAGLSEKKIKYAHALIGRSIFIRYLEDRNILTENYFWEIAKGNEKWERILKEQRIDDMTSTKALYPQVLSDKAFTYALFKKLAQDFNGDMFPGVEDEENKVLQKHLTLIQRLLYGDTRDQQNLFFYSYRFDIVPLDLISAIYEEFYQSLESEGEKKAKARQDGAFYTPPSLAEFVLSRTLKGQVLEQTPRVLDPACGSGIFLVEAFRRIVRHAWHKKGAPLEFNELKQILKSQIAGIEINEEAARITAFSLYLAMLHYLDPPCILEQIKQGNKLPNLLVTETKSINHFHSIWNGNSFDVDAIRNNRFLKTRFADNSFDVIVGNPPWGAKKPNRQKAPERYKEVISREAVMLDWCAKNNRSISNKEPSQAFLWRSLDYLKDGGTAGLLVPAGILLKHSAPSKTFRKQWTSSIHLNEIVNFTHVRRLFFKGADSPFISISYSKQQQDNSPVAYWSAKRVIALEKTQAVLLSISDRHLLRNEDLADGQMWKTYWFGRHADAVFLKQLAQLPRLIQYTSRKETGQGFKLSPPEKPVEWNFPQLNIKSFSQYGTLTIDDESPSKVYRKGCESCYEGSRLLIKRGISGGGFIVSRYEEGSFSFPSSIIGLKLKEESVEANKLLLGILWSSFTRYVLFQTSSSWGIWHDENDMDDELLQLPINLDLKNKAAKRIIRITDKLRGYQPQLQNIEHPDGIPSKTTERTRRKWEAQLDEAVYDLYNLSEEQRDLIRDCCEVTLPFFYKPYDSVGAMHAVSKKERSWIGNYAQIFSKRWKPYLDNDEEMRVRVHLGAHDNMVALEFFPADKTDEWNLQPEKDSWGYILEQLGESLPQPMSTSQILLDGVVHAVSDDWIIVIKRNEKRLWTRSMAREDADTTLSKCMRLELLNSAENK